MLNRLSDIVRLLLTQNFSMREIATSLDVSKTTVGRYGRVVAALGRPWKGDLEALPGSALAALFNQPRRVSQKVAPDWAEFDRRLAEPGMTIYQLWEDYAEAHGAHAMSYSQCARSYRTHRGLRTVSLRQTHAPGRAVFVDYSGVRPFYIDRATGQQVPVELFVAVLGASSYTFVCCSASQSVPDWLDAHVKMVEFFGGVPASVVPDNLKSAVTKCGPEPVVQRNYLEWARHYNVAVLPARPGHPRDKGIVEGAVLFVQRQMLPTLAKSRFYSLDELNAAVAKLLTRLNARAFQKRSGSRQSTFDSTERSALQPLPASRYVYRQWVAKQTVPPDYHIAVHGHFYSVPFELVGKRIEACISPGRVEVFCDGQRVAAHARQTTKGGHTTDPAHQPEAHRAQGERTPDHLLQWAAEVVGPNMREVMARQFRQKVPLQGLPAAIALRSLEKAAAPADLERTAGLALARRVPHPTGMRRLLGATTTPDPFAPARQRVGLGPVRRSHRRPAPSRPTL